VVRGTEGEQARMGQRQALWVGGAVRTARKVGKEVRWRRQVEVHAQQQQSAVRQTSARHVQRWKRAAIPRVQAGAWRPA